MNKLINFILKTKILVKEGYKLKGKILIGLIMVIRSISYIVKNKKYCEFLDSIPLNVKIRNEGGLFNCYSFPSVWAASSLYEKEIIEYLKIKHGSFIDVGANFGKYSVIIGNKMENYEKIISIEPESKNFKILIENLKLNNIKRVIPLKIACFSKNTKMKLYLSQDKDPGRHSLIKKGEEYEFVKCLKLDKIVLDYKIKEVSLIKIDVEGAEKEVLEGAFKTLKRDRPKIIFEALDEKYLKKCKNFLNKFNYTIIKLNDTNYLAY